MRYNGDDGYLDIRDRNVNDEKLPREISRSQMGAVIYFLLIVSS